MKRTETGGKEPEVVNPGGVANTNLIRIIKLYEELEPGEKRIVRRHVNGEMPFIAIEDPTQLLSTAAAAQLLEVSFQIVLRLVEEHKLIPDEITETPLSINPKYKFTLATIHKFIRTHGTGHELYLPNKPEKFKAPDINWELEGKHPIDYEMLMTQIHWKWKSGGGLSTYIPFKEIKPILDELLNELSGRSAYVVQGRLRGHTNKELAEHSNKNAATISAYFTSAMIDVQYGVAGAKLALIRKRFSNKFRCDSDKGICRNCGTNLREKNPSLCPKKERPPQDLSIFNLVTQEQLNAMNLPFRESGVSRQLVTFLENKDYRQLGHAYRRLNGPLPRDLERRKFGPEALQEIMNIYIKFGLLD